MSRHSVVYEVKTKALDEIVELYGIEITGSGSVYDPCEGTRYKDINAWATAMDDEHDRGGFSPGYKQGQWEE